MATATLGDANDPNGLNGQLDGMDRKLNRKIEYNEETVRDSDLFKINTSTLRDERLAGNEFYTKLIGRLDQFYLVAEKLRLMGPNARQQEEFKKSGFSFEYRMRLHKCLKKLLLEVVAQRDDKI